MLEVGRRGSVAGRLGRCVVELELDGVRAGLGGDLDHADRVPEAAVVVHAGLGDDVDAHRAPMLAAAPVNPVLGLRVAGGVFVVG